MWKRWQGVAHLYDPLAVVLAVCYGCQSKAQSSEKRAQAGSRKRPKWRKADKLNTKVERKWKMKLNNDRDQDEYENEREWKAWEDANDKLTSSSYSSTDTAVSSSVSLLMVIGAVLSLGNGITVDTPAPATPSLLQDSNSGSDCELLSTYPPPCGLPVPKATIRLVNMAENVQLCSLFPLDCTMWIGWPYH